MTTEQRSLFELLKTFSAICDEYGLQYFLVGGTLLGAVRHQGFIPWDDDVDVAMPHEDYQRFLTLIDMLPDGIELQARETDVRYPFLFGKLCDTRIPYNTSMPYGPRGLYIDIFPLVPAKKDSAVVRLKFNLTKVVDYILQIRSGWAKNIPYKNAVAKLGFWALNHFSTGTLMRIQQHFIRQILGDKKSKLVCSFGGAYKADKEFYPKAWFAESVFLPFGTSQFKAPYGWHAYLSRNYGDYMTLPSKEEQVSKHK